MGFLARPRGMVLAFTRHGIASEGSAIVIKHLRIEGSWNDRLTRAGNPLVRRWLPRLDARPHCRSLAGLHARLASGWLARVCIHLGFVGLVPFALAAFASAAPALSSPADPTVPFESVAYDRTGYGSGDRDQAAFRAD